MSHHGEELMFGSDSFLDVMSNMVGILIILIVVVLGMRVAPPPGTAPLTFAKSSPESVKPAASAPASSPVVSTAAKVPELPPEPLILEALPEFPPLPEIKPGEELLQQAAAVREENLELTRQLATLRQEADDLKEKRLDLAEQTNMLRLQVSEKVDVLRSDRSQISTLETNVVELKAEVAALQQRLAEAPDEKAPVEQLTHRLPPIGKVVSGEEIHFRLQGNKVTWVPIAELAQEVQRDIERRKEILLSRSFYQGSTRAIDGYLMEYVLQRLNMTLADELRSSPGMVRIGVTNWVIRPVGPFQTESAEEAVRPDSRFCEALKDAGPTATVTFWVYPDSFEIHHKLTEMAHQANFWVASRPLPEGVPIAGSPQGSKSVAQ